MQVTKIKKILTALLVVTIVGVGSYYGYKKYTSSKVTTTAKFATAKVKRTDIAVTVEGTGTVSSVEETDIYSSNGGIVQELPFKLGDTVKSGDLFCRIDDTTSQKSIDTDRNNIAQKTLDLKNLEITLDNLYIKAPIDGTVTSVFAAAGDDIASLKPAYGGLAMLTTGSLEIPIPFPSSGKISQVYVSSGSTVKKGDTLFKLDDSTIKNNIEGVKLQIQQLQNDLNTQQNNLAKTSIICPKDGIVSTLAIKQGDYVDNTKLIAAIINPSNLQIIVPVDEMDIDKVKAGEDATIKVDDIKDKTYAGHVEKVSPVGKTTNNVTTYDVTLSLENSERLRLGMNANVTIAVEKKANVLSVPTEAITERNGKKYVTVQSSTSSNGNASKGTNNVQRNSDANNSGNNNSQSKSGNSNTGNSSQSRNTSSGQNSANRNSASIPGKPVAVETGIQNQNMVEIISGLSENETVIIQFPQSSGNNNQNMMRNGASGFGGTGAGGAARTSGGGGKN